MKPLVMMATYTIMNHKVVNYRSDSLTITSDLRSPFTVLGEDVEWRSQFKHAINNQITHAILERKLLRFGPTIIYYSKILPDIPELLRLADYSSATIWIITSVGEHLLTPWMIVHNIGHALISNDIWVKRDVLDILGPNGSKGEVLCASVNCESAKRKVISNINELLYELFASWVWCGSTNSENAELVLYCDRVFEELMRKRCGTALFHKYR